MANINAKAYTGQINYLWNGIISHETRASIALKILNGNKITP